MSTLRVFFLAAPLALLAAAATAQTPAAPDAPPPMAGMESGGATQPMMEQGILTHILLISSKVASTAPTPSSAGTDQQFKYR
jgi:hypothetical protein